jgi:predicted Fe-Mo cluster-binding NifX family protein
MSSMKNIEALIVAVATDDGKTYIDRHFGDAKGYDLYEITETGVTFLKRLSNTTEEDAGEDVHGDAEKAMGIAAILANHGVQITVSRVYGPNLKRIRKRFVCVIDQTGTIEQMLQRLKDMHAELVRQWSDSTERTLIRL